MDQWINLISGVGFPIVMTIFLLMRVEKSIEKLDKSIDVLTVVVAKMCGVDHQEARDLANKNGGKRGGGFFNML